MTFEFFTALFVAFTGIAIMAVKRDLVVKLVGLGILETGVTLIFVVVGYTGPFPPMITLPIDRVDPLPQALVITSIVVGFASLALSLVFVVYLAGMYHTTDVVKLKKRIKDER